MSLRAVHAEIAAWRAAGRPIAVATVAATWGSAPCPVGSVLAVAAPECAGDFPSFAGAVSGGCVEASVIDIALEILAGAAPRLLRFGVSDETALSVGLACGGTIEVWVEPLDDRPDRRLWREAAASGSDLRRLVVIEAGSGKGEGAPVPIGAGRAVQRTAEAHSFAGSLGAPALDAAADRRLLGEDEDSPAPLAGLRTLLLGDEAAGPLILVGAGHIAQQLAPMARRLDFEVVVVDPRAAFLEAGRFPATRVIHAWPDANTLHEAGLGPSAYLVALAHDPKIDEPALRAALEAGARYVGALGGRSSHAARVARLRELGVAEPDVARIRGPVGLDIGARTPAEIALSISAELVAVRRGAR